MADPLAITLHASAAESASGASTPVDVGTLRKCARLKLEVSAISGTGPGFEVVIETGPSSSGPWRGLGGWSVDVEQAVARLFGETDRYVRASWTISGDDSPAVTFALVGEAHVLYVTPSQIDERSLPASAMDDLIGPLFEACLGATAEADGYLARRYTLPLSAWDDALIQHTSHRALWYFMSRRGFGPQGPDEVMHINTDAALKWLDGVGAGRISPPGIIDATPEKRGLGARVRVRSRPSRGFC